MHSHTTCWLIFFSLFWNDYFCQYCFILSRYIFYFSFFWLYLVLFSPVVFFILLELFFFFFPSQHVSGFYSRLILFACFCSFHIQSFPVEFPIQVLSFCSCYLEEHRFYHRLISLLCWLECLILWHFSLRNVLIIRLFFSFCFDCFSFLAMVILSSFQTWSSLKPFLICVNICSAVWVCVVSIVITLSFISAKGVLFSVSGVLIIVLGFRYIDSLFIFWCISNVSKSEKQRFFMIILTL